MCNFVRPLSGPHLLIFVLAILLPICCMPTVYAGTNPIQQENSLPGTPGWHDFAASSQQDLISGFGSKISVNHGDSIDLYVTTTAASYTIDIFRTGYYQGIGARLIQSLGSFPGIHQAIPAPDKVTGMISCSTWTPATTVQIPSTWVTGVYVAKLTSSTGHSSFIFFVVRDDTGTADLVFQTSVSTYQAYNNWGGTSLYQNTTNNSVYPYPHATKVSYDRPFDPNDGDGAGHYFLYEDKFVYWLESQGYNVAYTTDVDTDLGTTPLTNHKAFLSVGHDEYWSRGMRTNVQNAINAGVNAAFFSGNSVYWQIRFEPNAAGLPNRVQVGYKDFATANTAPGPDPMWGVNNAIVTTYWRDPPVNEPENALMGVMFEDQVNSNFAYIVSDASSWVFANTGLVNGSSVPGIVGYEYDKVWNNGFTPPGLKVLSSSPVKNISGQNSVANSTIYTAASGAQVFAAGTIQWSWALANVDGNTFTDTRIQQTTANILNTFISNSAASAALNPNTLTFTSVVGTTSATQTATLTSTGSTTLSITSITIAGVNAGDFAQTNDCPSTLALNQFCTISVSFTPSATGSRSASVVITDNAGNSPQTVVLSGTGQASAAPAVALNPASLAFGTRVVGSVSSPLPVTLTNSGTAALIISSISLGGTNAGDFAQTNNCPMGPATLAVNASCTISVTFSPSGTGVRSGTLVIVDNDPTSPQSVPLSGTGTTGSAGVNVSPTSLTYTGQLVGTSSTAQTITLTSTGTAPLSITSILLSGTNPADFTETSNCPSGTSTLAVNASCTISVTFSPTARGTRTATLTVNSNAAGTAPSVSLSGTGAAPIAKLSPVSLTFAALRLTTTSAAKSVTLSNTGNATLNITSIAVTGDFSQTNTCGSTLAPASSCTVSVRFSPIAVGTRTGTLTIGDDSFGGSPQTTSLSGTGEDFSISASPTSAIITGGSTAAFTVTASTVGDSFTWSVNLSCSGLPKGAKCTFSSTPLVPGAGTVSSGLSISSTAGSRGTPKGTYTITVTGTSGSLVHTSPVTLQVN